MYKIFCIKVELAKYSLHYLSAIDHKEGGNEMKQYECMLILSTSLDDEQKEGLIKKFSDVITNDGGLIVSIDKWGIKKLAYAINFKREGYYVLLNFSAEGAVVKKVQSLMNITEGVMRSMFIAK